MLARLAIITGYFFYDDLGIPTPIVFFFLFLFLFLCPHMETSAGQQRQSSRRPASSFTQKTKVTRWKLCCEEQKSLVGEAEGDSSESQKIPHSSCFRRQGPAASDLAASDRMSLVILCLRAVPFCSFHKKILWTAPGVNKQEGGRVGSQDAVAHTTNPPPPLPPRP